MHGRAAQVKVAVAQTQVVVDVDLVTQLKRGGLGFAQDAQLGDVQLHIAGGDFVGLGGAPDPDKVDMHVTDAGGTPTTIKAGGAFFDSAASFCLIRGGHVDVTILGAMQVDEKGDIANYKIPGKMVAGMGGAMDLLVGAKEVIVAMEHTNKGKHKILEKCTLPLTAKGENGTHLVDMIITDMGVMKVTDDGLVLTEYNPEFTLDQIQEATGAKLIIAEDLKEMEA